MFKISPGDLDTAKFKTTIADMTEPHSSCFANEETKAQKGPGTFPSDRQ